MQIFKNNLIKKILISFFIMVGVFQVSPVSATIWSNIKVQGGFETVGRDVFGNETPKGMGEIVAEIINFVLSFLGVIFLVLTVYAGFLWMTAAGDSDKVETAKSILVSSSIGLAIILSSYAISYFIIKGLTTASS